MSGWFYGRQKKPFFSLWVSASEENWIRMTEVCMMYLPKGQQISQES